MNFLSITSLFDIHQPFNIESVNDSVEALQAKILLQIEKLKKVIQDDSIPNIDIGPPM